MAPLVYCAAPHCM